MSDGKERHVEAPGPTDFQTPTTRRELERAAVWLGLATFLILTWWLAQPILLIVGGLVFAAMLDGGTRLLGRVLPIARGWRLAIVAIGVLAFFVWMFYFAGSQLVGQFDMLRTTVQAQLDRLMGWGRSIGLITGGNQIDQIGRQLMGSLGQLTTAVGSALGAVTSLAMIVVIGIFVAIEPKLYERGFAWLLPMDKRAEFYATSDRAGFVLRRLMAGRLLGMAVEGVGTWALLAIGGVPMAVLLGLLTGVLAFLPNIGAIVSGVLIILVGFANGTDSGLYAIGVYVTVQVIDGYIIVPMVAKRSVDLAPALVLGAQLLLGALFGILGLALADPIVAMIKVLLEDKSENAAEEAAAAAPTPPPAAGA